MQILIIEPDAILSNLYRQSIEEAGHQVMWCTDAEAAIQLADEQTPDVVVLELQMAGHNGVEFLYEFRSYPEWKDVPIIILSGVPDAAFSPILQRQLGITAYHYKPRTKLHNLVNTLDRLAAAA
jgi:DNA-binding response OmpR family regulator